MSNGDRRRTPFNGLPIPQGMMLVQVDPSFLKNQQVSERTPTKSDENKKALISLQEEMGYKRFVQCAGCGESCKIFTCFENSEKARCKVEGNKVPTHTHVDCSCSNVIYGGLVQFVTKTDTIKPKAPSGDTVTISKEEYEAFVKSKEDAASA